MSIFSDILLKPKSPTPSASGSLPTGEHAHPELYADAVKDATKANKVAKRSNSFLGILLNTDLGVPDAARDFVKETAQGVARTVGTVGITAANTLTKASNKINKTNNPVPFDTEIPTTGNKFTDILFGGKPIKDIKGAGQSAVDTGNRVASTFAGKDVSPVSKSLAVPFGIAGSLLDLSGFGGKKGVKALTDEVPEQFLKYMSKEKNPTVIENTLKGIGLDEVNSKTLSESLAKARSVDEVKSALLAHGQQAEGSTGVFKNILKTPESNISSEIRTAETASTKTPRVVEQVPTASNQKPIQDNVPTTITKPEEQRAMIDEMISEKKQKLQEHPGKKLQQFISKKEGQFLDFPNPETAKTPAERIAAIQRIKKITNAAQNTMGGDNFDNPDAIRAHIEDYQKTKQELTDLQEQRKLIKDEPISVPSVNGYTPPSLDEVVSLAQKYKGHPEDFKTAVLSGDDEVLPFYKNNVRPTPKIDEAIVDAILKKGGYENLDDVFYKANLKVGKARRITDTRNFPQGTNPLQNQQTKQVAQPQRAPASVARVQETASGSDLGSGDSENQSYQNDTTPKTKAQVAVQKSIEDPVTTPEEAKESFQTYERGDRAIDNDVITPISKGELEDITQKAVNFAYKPVTGFMGKIRDVYRNFEKFFAKDYEHIKKLILDPFDKAKGEYVDMKKQLADELYDEVVKKFDIKKGSKESAAVMDYGERNLEGDFVAPYTKKNGPRDEHHLVAEFGREKADNIIAADAWFRNKYDSLVDAVNAERKKVYGAVWEKKKNLDSDIEFIKNKVKEKQAEIDGKKRTDTLVYQKMRRRLEALKKMEQARRDLMESDLWWRGKIIPKRADYYRHFQELAEGFKALRNIIGNDANISTHLAGISLDTKPKSKYLSFAQAREGNRSVRDAVGGFMEYIPSASYATHIDPHIERFRKLGDALADSDNKAYSPFINYLSNFANDLSGKTNGLDREIQEITGRKFMQVLNWVNNRVKANTILGNVSSSLAQISNVPQGIASAKQYSINGLTRTLAQIFDKNVEMEKSSFMKERYSDGIFNKFDTGIFDRTKQGAAKMLGVLDEIGTKFIWNSHYAKAIAEKIEDPIKYADDVTRSLVAGRGIGEAPLIQKSKMFQLVAPFQLEVGNTWFAMRDMWGKNKKQALASLAIFFIANYILNRVMEKARGSDVTFDPIEALIEGSQELANTDNKKRGAALFAGRLAGEVLSNIPLGQTLAALYPEKGFGSHGIDRSEFFGKGDPTRYGSGLLATKALGDPLFKILPPFGGSQIEKTYKGLRSYFSGEVKNAAGDTNYQVKKGVGTAIQMGLFGKYGTPDAQNFFDKQDKLYSIITEQKNSTGDLQLEAEKEWDRLKEIGQENQDEAATQFDTLFQENPDLADKVYKVYEEEQLGLNKTDRLIKQLGVKNGDRARYIFAEVSDMNDADREKYYGDLIEKGVVTQEVSDQIATMVSGNKPTFQDGQEVSKTGVIHSVVTFAKAIGVDPKTAFKALFTREQLEYVKGNVAVLKRIEFQGKKGSEAIAQRRAKEQGVDRKTMRLDHIIPLEIGGDNSEANLNLVTTEEWEKNTPVENFLGKAVREKTLTLKQARSLIERFKSGEITAEDVYNSK